MPWYAAGEQRKPNQVWIWFVERSFASQQEADDAARHEAKSGDDWLDPAIVTFEAKDLAQARNETIRRGLDWRLLGQESWFKDLTLTWKKYDQPFHDHCVFCWRKFLNRDDPEIGPEWFEDEYVEDAGYAALAHGQFRDYYHWVCRYCFPDFVSVFGWTVVSEPKKPFQAGIARDQ